MKKKLFIIALPILTLTCFISTPKVVQANIPSVYYVTPNQTTYESTVYCNGTVQSQNVQDMYVQSLVVPEQVLVSVGDMVEIGDTIVKIDKSATELLSATPTQTAQRVLASDSAQQVGQVDWTSMAREYGLSAIVNGGAGDIGGLLESAQNEMFAGVTANSGAFAQTVMDDIVSPISGVVTSVTAKKDAPLAAGQSFMTISDTKGYKVFASVNEANISKIKINDAAKISGVGFAGSKYTGYVSKIYPTAHRSLVSASETVVDIEITLNSSDQNIKPGFSAKVEIMGENDYEMITVPYEAIRQDQNNDEYVYTYQNGKIQKANITTGQEMIEQVEVLDGIDYGTVVIFNPSTDIKEGTMINIKGRAGVN